MNKKNKLFPLNTNILILLVVLIMALIQSCEYELDKENFIEKEPVPDTHMFEITSTPEGDTIEVFERTTFHINLNTFGLTPQEVTITLGDQSWSYSMLMSYEARVTIDPEEYSTGYHKLQLEMFTNSGTGTIADQVGAEGYVVEKEWAIYFDHRPAPELAVEKSINSKQQLTFRWDKCTNENFESYELRISRGDYNYEQIIISDPNKIQYIDSLFFGGEYSFRLYCNTINSESSISQIEFTDPVPQLYYEEIGFDSLRFSWKASPYNARYKLSTPIYGEHYYLNEPDDTTLTIPNLGFGIDGQYTLYTSSIHYDNWNTDPSEHTYIDYGLGEQTSAVFSMSYNSTNNIIYSQKHNNFNAFDANTFNQLSTVYIDDLNIVGNSSSPTNSSKVVVGAKDKLYHFENQNLENPLIIEYEEGSHYSSVDYMLYTDNNKICYAYSYDSKFKIIDIETQQVETIIDIPDYPVYSKWACLTASQNGEYFCVVTLNGLKLYKITDGVAEEAYTDNRTYRSAYFDPEDPDLLYLTLYESSELEVRNPSDFNLLNTIEIGENTIIQNIDPVSDLLLVVTDHERIHVINPQSSSIILSIPYSGFIYGCRLYNNKLINQNGMTLNLYEKLNK